MISTNYSLEESERGDSMEAAVCLYGKQLPDCAGVSMGGEALAVLCENFDFIGTGNFMECYCRYAYPSGSEDLSVSQKIKQSRIPDFTFDEEELGFLSGE